MKKILSFLIVVVILCLVVNTNIFAEQQVYDYYCKRNKEHKQPSLEDNMKFIEQYNGYYIDKTHNDENTEKVIYLTFDAGYENGNIERILNILDAENVKGAFFILRNLVDRNSELVLRMINSGHLVCNHTSKHPDMTKFTNIEEFSAELEALERVYHEKTAHEISKYYRPPCGKFSKENLDFANQLGYKTIFWSFGYADWDNDKQMSAEKAKEIIFSNIHNGEVMLLHPTSKTNADILSDVIRELKKQGYRFGTLDELTATTN